MARNTITLDNALNRYIKNHALNGSTDHTIKTVRNRVGRFIAGRENVCVKKIKRKDIVLHFREMEETGLKEGTLAGHSSTITAFFKYCKKKGWAKKNPAKVLRNKRFRYSYKPVTRTPAPEGDFQIVINCLPQFVARHNYDFRDVRDALIVSLAIDSACRRGEIRNIRRLDMVRAVANNGRIYRVQSRGKTGAAIVRFFEDTAAIARLWLNLLPDTAVWLFENPKTKKRFHADHMSKAFVQVCDFANVPVFRFQATRKRDVIDMIKSTGDAAMGQKLAGHSRIETTQIYYNMIDDSDVDEAAAKLSDNRRGNESELISNFFRLLE